MNTYETKYNGQFSADFAYTGGGWGQLGTGPLSEFFRLLWELHGVVPLASVEIHETATSPSQLSLMMTAQDGRQWQQMFIFDAPDNPGQTFAISDPWRLTEFVKQRPLRDEIVRLHNAYHLTKVEVTVTP